MFGEFFEDDESVLQPTENRCFDPWRHNFQTWKNGADFHLQFVSWKNTQNKNIKTIKGDQFLVLNIVVVVVGWGGFSHRCIAGLVEIWSPLHNNLSPELLSDFN